MLLAKETPVLPEVLGLVHLEQPLEQWQLYFGSCKWGEADGALVEQRAVRLVLCLALHIPFPLDVVLPLLNLGASQDLIVVLEPVVGLKQHVVVRLSKNLRCVFELEHLQSA